MATKMTENALDSSLESSDISDAAEAHTSEVRQLAEIIKNLLVGNETGEFDKETLVPLKKLRDNLKKMDVRKQLDELLCQLNINIDTVAVYLEENRANREENQVDVFTETKTRDLIQILGAKVTN